MKVKKFRATTMPEVMKLVRNELGNDAIILNSRVVHTGGFLGLFKKRRIEVVAALDPSGPRLPKPSNKGYVPAPFKENKETQNKEQKAFEELLEIKTFIKKAESRIVNEKAGEGIPLPYPIEQLKELLVEQEVAERIVDETIHSLIETWYKQGGGLSFAEIQSLAKEQLMTSLSDLSFGGITLTKKYINIVGPTGVGKTTTLAKIAAQYILSSQKKVAFITTDTYRIAAIEQLKIYANILTVPVEVCYNFEDFQRAKKKFEAYDLVFVDTAGRNFRNEEYVRDLKTIIDFNEEMETLLVLSLTSKQRDIEAIVEQFSLIDVDKFIFTKIDETSTYGTMYNMIKKERVGVAYITNGQDVPDDLVTATPEIVVDFIVGADLNGRSSRAIT